MKIILRFTMLLASIGFSLLAAYFWGEVSAAPNAQTKVYLPLIQKQDSSTPAGVTINSNHSSYVDSINQLNIFGEVINNSSSHIEDVEIKTNIYNSIGQVIRTGTTNIYLGKLQIGDRTCFHLSLPEPSGWAYYKFESPGYRSDASPLPILTVLNDSASYDPSYGWVKVSGQIRNDHGSRVEYVMPVGTLYNGAGTVIGCDFTFVNGYDLEPGQTGSFDLYFSGRNYSDARAYRLQVNGRP